MRLLRHPVPGDHEGILGYFLRLSEHNGYLSPRQLRNYLGIPPHEALSAKNSLRKIADATGHRVDPTRERPDEFRLPSIFTDPLDGWLLLVQEARAEAHCCPQCIKELGFVEAHWASEYIVACPQHRRLAVRSCAGCKRSLSWHRPGMLECECGALLKPVAVGSISTAEVALLDVIRRKLLRLPIGKNPQGFPSGLLALELQPFLRVLDTVARLQTGSLAQDKRQVIYLSARAFRQWPRGFIELLKPTDKNQRRVRKHIVKVYRDLCGGSNKHGREFEFMGRVIAEYALRHGYRHSSIERYKEPQERSCGQPESSRPEETNGQRAPANLDQFAQTVTGVEAARLLECSPTAIPGLVRSGRIIGTIGPQGWWVDPHSVEAFDHEYVFLSPLAANLGTTLVSLRKVCRLYGVEVFRVAAAHASTRLLFTRRYQVEHLASLVRRRQQRK